MMIKRIRLPGIFFLLISIFAATTYLFAAQNPDAIIGNWFTENNSAQIQIYKQNNKYFGKIVWLKNPRHPNGKPKLDQKNPNNKLRGKPLIGLIILRSFIYAGDNTWEEGNVYDPESGNDYSCTMTLIASDKLHVRGYIGISLLGRTQTWTRAK